MVNSKQIVRFEEIVLEVEPNGQYEWIMNSSTVAAGYGIAESSLRSTKSRNESEIIEGKHFITVANCNSNPRNGIAHNHVFWTKRGVVRLGFFIKSARGKAFRDWAEDLIIAGAEKQPNFDIPRTLPDALRKYADSKENEERLLIENQKKESAIRKQEAVIEYLEPLAIIGKSYELQDGSVPLGTFAPIIGYGQNTLFERLRADKILISKGVRHNQPYAQYRDWFEVKPMEIKTGPRAGKPYWQTQVTMKGQTRLIKLYQKPIVHANN